MIAATATAQSTAQPSLVDILAIGAHRDDVEQTCGGTLLKMRSLGLETGILDLTQGEAGTRGSAAERAADAAPQIAPKFGGPLALVLDAADLRQERLERRDAGKSRPQVHLAVNFQ